MSEATIPTISVKHEQWIDATGSEERVGGTELCISGDKEGLKKLAEIIAQVADSQDEMHTHISSDDTDNITISDANILLTIELK